jgi:hypothetical protein
MEKKKTLKFLNDMKNNKMSPFGNQYEFFFATLENYYIAKMNGKERIKIELSKWDSEAQKEIVNILANIIESDGLIGFDRNDILSLIN